MPIAIYVVILYFVIQICLLQDLKEAKIPPEDVIFLFVGKTTRGEIVNYDPWSGTALFE